jgi:hypothetical protein
MSRRGRQAVAGLTLSCALLALAAAFPPAGKAATYNVIECSRAQGAPTAPDAVAAGSAFIATNRCGPSSGPDGLEVHGTLFGSESNARTSWLFHAPPDTRFVRASVFAAGASEGGVVPELRVWNTSTDPPAGSQFGDAGNIGQPGTSLAWNGEAGPMNLLEIRLICVPPAGCVSIPGEPDAFINATSIAFALEETSPPALTTLEGPLVDSRRSVRGTADLLFGGTDAGAGLHTTTLSVSGRTVAAGTYACDLTATGVGRRLVPCPGSAQQTLAVDTRDPGFHTGLNRVAGCVADFAGQTACAERDVRVDNECPSSSGVAALKRIRITGRGVGKRSGAKRRVVVNYGRGVKLRGRAVGGASDEPDSGGGGPDSGVNPPNPGPDPYAERLRGATVCLGERAEGQRYAPERIKVTKTGKRGRFRFRLGKGPSRALRIAAFRHGEPVEVYRTLLVRARPALKIGGKRRPGKALRFDVRLREPISTRQRVEIRARSDAGWVGLPGCDGRSNPDGRFRCRFEIPRGAGGAQLQFRAVVVPNNDYPYLKGHSLTRTVKVRR